MGISDDCANEAERWLGTWLPRELAVITAAYLRLDLRDKFAHWLAQEPRRYIVVDRKYNSHPRIYEYCIDASPSLWRCGQDERIRRAYSADVEITWQFLGETMAVYDGVKKMSFDDAFTKMMTQPVDCAISENFEDRVYKEIAAV
jgi:hypothetical protein